MKRRGAKKARGWRRRMRALDRWAVREVPLEPEHLDGGYHSAEVWLEHWPQPVPLAVRRRLVRHLVDVHDRWRERLDVIAPDAYLGIWLFEPALNESQVVAAVGARADEYRARHDAALRATPPAPYHGHPVDLARFRWTRHVHDDADAALRHESWLAILP